MKAEIIDIKGIGPSAAKTLKEHGFTTPAALANASIEEIVAVPGFSAVRAAAVKEAADLLVFGGDKVEQAGVMDEVEAAVSADTVSKSDTKKGKKKDKDKKKGKKKDKDKKKGKKKDKDKKKGKKKDKDKKKGKKKK